MARTDRQSLAKAVFGEQFSSLPARLNDPDPRERVKSLSLLETYLDDCLKPILELKRQIAAAVYEAERQSRMEPISSYEPVGRSSAKQPRPREQTSSREKQIAIIESLVGDP